MVLDSLLLELNEFSVELFHFAPLLFEHVLLLVDLGLEFTLRLVEFGA